jgi:hypothetical protein
MNKHRYSIATGGKQRTVRSYDKLDENCGQSYISKFKELRLIGTTMVFQSETMKIKQEFHFRVYTAIRSFVWAHSSRISK